MGQPDEEGLRRDPRGALVRPYAVTRGRTEPRQDIAIEAVLVTTAVGRQEGRFSGQHKQRIAAMCDGAPRSLAEVGALLRMPFGVARVLVADMVAEGLLELHQVAREQTVNDRLHVLERVLSGLRRL
ncbi:MAG: DUF742 domain-containing protein [Streptomycetaceae bacterium]|nr:DUF742 domain-containing protein [Streptomycetaceae bacterium]